VREREIRDLPWSVYRATVVVEVHRLRCTLEFLHFLRRRQRGRAVFP